MATLHRRWSSPWILVVGWVGLLVVVVMLVNDALGAFACRDSGLMLSCDGPPDTSVLVLASAYALGPLYLTLRRWINGPTDEDQAD
jgi:hypothetical protein